MQERPENMWLFLDPKSSNYAKLAQIGIILLIVGMIIALIMQGFGPRAEEDYWGDRGPLHDWAVKVVYIGLIIFYIGVLFLTFSLFTIAMFAPNIHIYARVGLLIAIGLIIGPTLTVAFYGTGLWG